ncbi:MAG: recombinase RecT [Herbinix sp.]|jgi:recombination protein RecT|nr:recombinase RecT [Herbinix sp.]
MTEQTAVVKIGITQPGVEYVTNQLVNEEKKGLKFPVNYSLTNAMNSAYLMLKEAETKDGQPLLSVCTQDSVVLSLTQMATQGLNPVKKQCYFVAYGNKCKLVPSYFGTLAILNRVTSLKRQPIANVVRQGDVFEYGYNEDMEQVIYKHETKIDNLDSPILAAYAIIVTDKEKVIEIMSRQQLENAWSQGQSWKAAKKGNYESATHAKFSEEMAKKTVLNRASKRLINATDDSSVMGDQLIEAFNDTSDNDSEDQVQANVQYQITTNANTEEFVVPNDDPVEKVQGEVVDTPKKPETDKKDKQTKPSVSAPDKPDWMPQEG